MVKLDSVSSVGYFDSIKHLSTKIDCPESPEISSCVSLNIRVLRYRNRSSVPFHKPFTSSNYLLNSLIIRLMHTANTD